jgi:hypothetical protein
MSEQEKSINLQFYLRDKKIYWGGNVHLIDDELLQNFVSKYDPEVWSVNDQVVLFNWYTDKSYSCEKEKYVYNYKLQKKVYVTYDAVLTEEQAENLKDKLLELFEETRIKFLQKNKDVVKQQVLEQFNVSALNLRGLRGTLLSKSDWTQIPDVPLEPEVKEMWAQYRQVLRNITEDPNWSPRNILGVDFPIDPENYSLRYPNKEVEYLSTPDQFENHAAMLTKVKLTRFMNFLSLPSALPDEELVNLPYTELKKRLDKFINRIDPEMEVVIEHQTAYLGACSDSGTNLQSGLTDEARKVLAELIADNPDIYYADSAEKALNSEFSEENIEEPPTE